MDNNNSTVLAPGTTLTSQFGTYTVVRVLGQGGFGITYLVESTIYHGNIPVKVQLAIKEHFVSSMCIRDNVSLSINYSEPVADTVERSRDAFVKEARRVQALGINHPNIVRISEVFEANNTAYYVMEYLNGETLEQYVRRNGPLTYAETLDILMPIAEAVGVLHDNNLTHYDIKPQNIILATDENGLMRPVLIDFGLAKHYDHEGVATSTMAMVAFSVGYAPVEQYSGLTDFTPEADVYALAATMYFCLTGENPEQATTFDIDAALRRLQPLVPPQTLHGLEHALQMKRQQRTRDANQFISETFKDILVESLKTQPYHESAPDGVNDNPRIQDSLREPDNKSKSTKTNSPEKDERHRRISGFEWSVISLAGVLILMSLIGIFRDYISEDNQADNEKGKTDGNIMETDSSVDIPNITFFVEDGYPRAIVNGEWKIPIFPIVPEWNYEDVKILTQEDFDGDGITDALISYDNRGTTTWAFVTYAGNYDFTISNLFSDAPYYEVNVTTIGGQKVVDFTTTNKGETVLKARYRLKNGQPIKLALPNEETPGTTTNVQAQTKETTKSTKPVKSKDASSKGASIQQLTGSEERGLPLKEKTPTNLDKRKNLRDQMVDYDKY